MVTVSSHSTRSRGVTIYFLFGHLGRDLMLLEEGQAIVSGQVTSFAIGVLWFHLGWQVLAHLGDKEENGGWYQSLPLDMFFSHVAFEKVSSCSFSAFVRSPKDARSSRSLL